MESQVFDIHMLEGYFEEIQEVVREEKKGIKTSSYLDLLLYSELIMHNVVRFSNRILLEPAFRYYYAWILDIVTTEIPRVKLTSKEDKHIKMFYGLV